MRNSKIELVRPIPSCTIIIPTRDRLELLKPCVDGVLATNFPSDLEIIIVDNGSTDIKTLSYLDSILADTRVKVIRWEKEFNFSEINNMAARQSRNDVLCFLNNDIEITTSQWLDILVPVANMREVGAVGAMLLYPDQSIQHAGVSLDQDWIGLHIAHSRSISELEQTHELDQWYGVDAVTGACLLTRRQLFLDVGGFDEKELAISFNDVDYCLRLRKLGYPSIILPSVQLIHHESMSRNSDDLPENQPRALKEKQVMLSRWKDFLENASYKGEIPWRVKSSEYSPEEQIPLTEQIRLIKESLPYSGHFNHSHTAKDTFEEQFYLLEIDYKALETHARAMQFELDVIKQSKSWRLTAPLRSVVSFMVRAKQRLGLALVSTKIGRRIYSLRFKTNDYSEERVADICTEDLKKQYLDVAAKNLEEFISKGHTLKLPTPTKPKVSILLVLFNQAPLTLLCLKSLSEQINLDAEIIIIDNNSTDQSAQLLAQVVGARLICNEENVGFVHAVNQGASIATGEYLLLLNNDAILENGSLDAALRVFESEPNVGAVGGKIRLLDGTLQEAGSIIWNDGSCLGYGRGQNPDSPHFMFRRDVDYCSGAFLMTPRLLFEALKGLDTDYAPAYYEESDYCVRLKKAGYRIIYEPDANIIHYEFASSGGYASACELQQDHQRVFSAKHKDYLKYQYSQSIDNILKARSSSHGARVLVIDDRVPHTTLGAGFPRCREILHEMVNMDLQVTLYPLLVSFDDWADTYKTLPRSVEVMLYLGKDKLAEFLSQRLGFYDYIMISRNHNMIWLENIIRRDPSLITGAKIIYDSEALTAPREAAAIRLQGRKISPEKEQHMIAKELELARHADCVVAVSESEADVYRKASFPRVEVLGHTITPRLTTRPFAERRGFLFVGALRDSKSPNVDSLIWFCEKILPLIRQKLGADVPLIVVGDNSAPVLRRVSFDGVRYMGRQENILPLYDRSRVFIAPTRFAAGIPHKIHESAAYGLPVVATELLAEQLSWAHESELLTAKTDEDFANQCVRLYTDERLWESLRNSALESLLRDCSPDIFKSNLRNIFRI